MELLILKDGTVFARATDFSDGIHEYALRTAEELPEYPTDDAGRGKAWELQYVDDVLNWVSVDRELTQTERIEELEEQWGSLVIPEFVQPTGAHDAYRIGSLITFDGVTYESIIDNNVWSPSDYPTGWKKIN